MLHIVGTYEKAEEEEGEVYEVVNIKILKQATPNLRIINLYGITFLDDTHIEAFSSNCIQLQVKDLLNHFWRFLFLFTFYMLNASNWIIKNILVLFQVLCVNYCARVEGGSLKILLQRCRNLKCLMMQQTNLKSDNVLAAEWDKATNLQVCSIWGFDMKYIP